MLVFKGLFILGSQEYLITHNNIIMKTQKTNLISKTDRLVYVAPTLKIQKIELEYSVAAGSVNPSVQQQWGETETQTHDVDNNFWN